MNCKSVVVEYFPPHPFNRGIVLGLGENNKIEKFLKNIGVKIVIKTKEKSIHLNAYTPDNNTLTYTEIQNYESKERKLSKYCQFIGDAFIRFLEIKIMKSDNDVKTMTDFMDNSTKQILGTNNYKTHDYNFIRYPELSVVSNILRTLSSIKNKQIDVDVNEDFILISVFMIRNKSYDKWKKLGAKVIYKLNKKYPLADRQIRLSAAKALSIIYHNELDNGVLYLKLNRNIFWADFL